MAISANSEAPFRPRFGIMATFLCLSLLLLLFAISVSAMKQGHMLAFDPLVLKGLRDPARPAIPLGPVWFNTAMVDITAFGGVTGLTVLTTVITGYLLVSRRVAAALYLACATIGGAVVGNLLKMAVDRPRPEIVPHLVEVHSASFPSAHAMNSAIVYLTLGALLARTQTDRRTGIYIEIVAIALTLIIGFSRLYLGVHWPSDVLAGWILGSAWATACSLLARGEHLRTRG